MSHTQGMDAPPEGEQSNFERQRPPWGQNCGVSPYVMSHNENSNSITGAMTQAVLLGKRREDITELSKILLVRSFNNLSYRARVQ